MEEFIYASIGNLSASQFIQRNMANQIKEITESTERFHQVKELIMLQMIHHQLVQFLDLMHKFYHFKKQFLTEKGKLLTQTADSGLSSINNILARIRESLCKEVAQL